MTEFKELEVGKKFLSVSDVTDALDTDDKDDSIDVYIKIDGNGATTLQGVFQPFYVFSEVIPLNF